MWYFDERGVTPSDYKLETLCKYFGITTEGAHDALTDVRMCAALARRLREVPAEIAA
jgi:DNA polymerase III epsilon subunit-like protein